MVRYVSRKGEPFSFAGLHLQQFSELFLAKPSVTDDATHREGIDRIVARDRKNAGVVCHDDMLALAKHSEAGFLQSSNGVLVVDARELRHTQDATSTSRTVAFLRRSSRAARYSWMAACMFSSASFSDAPCDQHPGRPGTETLYPSSLCCSAILYFIADSPSAIIAGLVELV